MRIPQQVSERVKEAPAQALRAVFSGIGQVLLVADRIKSRAAEPEHAQPATAEPVPQPSATTVKDETRWRSLDETGNVRLIPGEDTPKAKPVAEVIEADGVAEVVPEPAVTSEPAVVSEPAAVTEQTSTESSVTPEAPATTPEAPATIPEASTTSLPVPNYDTLTIPSLRARLRNLDPAQLHTLIEYEKAHAGRADVLTMFERRIAKLESDGA
jgi:hypothetical protein